MTPKTKVLINLIVVLLLGVTMVSWVVLDLVGASLGKGPLKVTADFAGSGGVFTNQEVTYRGVLVGKVGDLSLNDDGVDIELVIDPRWRGRIPADVEATIGSKSAVGEQFVNLTPASDEDEPLEDGDVIARARTSLPVDFQELLRSLDAVLADVPPGTTRRVVSELADGLRGRSGDIQKILQSLGTLSEGFASVAEEQKRLLDNSTVVAQEFLRSKDAFSRAIRAADDVFAGIGDEPEELRALLSENDRLAREGIGLLARRGSDLRAGIRELARFTSFQLDERDSVEQSLTYLPQFLKAIEEASVPWVSPEGDRFYRIRVGLVIDQDDGSSWPCRYKRGERYFRHYFVRDEKKLVTEPKCEASGSNQRGFIQALRDLADEAGSEVGNLDLGRALSPTGYVGTGISFGWPAVGPVTSGFGPRWGRLHAGIDIDGVTGDPISASADGVVIASGNHQGGYGNVVTIDHGDGFITLYAHLSRSDVVAGQRVRAGDQIGAMGCTGSCTGDHLHFEIRADGVPVDPLLYLPGGPLFVFDPQSDAHSH